MREILKQLDIPDLELNKKTLVFIENFFNSHGGIDIFKKRRRNAVKHDKKENREKTNETIVERTQALSKPPPPPPPPPPLPLPLKKSKIYIPKKHGPPPSIIPSKPLSPTKRPKSPPLTDIGDLLKEILSTRKTYGKNTESQDQLNTLNLFFPQMQVLTVVLTTFLTSMKHLINR